MHAIIPTRWRPSDLKHRKVTIGQHEYDVLALAWEYAGHVEPIFLEGPDSLATLHSLKGFDNGAVISAVAVQRTAPTSTPCTEPRLVAAKDLVRSDRPADRDQDNILDAHWPRWRTYADANLHADAIERPEPAVEALRPSKDGDGWSHLYARTEECIKYSVPRASVLQAGQAAQAAQADRELERAAARAAALESQLEQATRAREEAERLLAEERRTRAVGDGRHAIEVGNLQAARSLAETNAGALAEQNAALQRQLEQENREKTRLEVKRDEEHRAREAAQKMAAAGTERATRAQAALNDASQQLREARARAEEAEKASADRQAQVDRYVQELEQARLSESADAAARIASLEASLNDARAALDRQDETTRYRQRNADSLQRERDALAEDMRRLQTLLEGYQNGVRQARHELPDGPQ